MKVAFAGTPAFAATALRALLQAGHDVALVVTQPDRAAGRGLELQISPVKAVALNHSLPLTQPVSLGAGDAREVLERSHARVMVVAAYGLILPQAVLDLFPLGCINIHASLLPRWRGAAPIQRALLAGDSQTGISIMQMDAGLDTGGVLLMETISIGPHDTSQSLHDSLAELAGRCIVRALSGIEAGTLAPQTQATTGVTYAQKINKEEAELHWQLSAVELGRRVRAFNPTPVATTWKGDERVRVWAASPLASPSSAPGTVLRVDEDGVYVACGEGVLRLEELQRAGGRRLLAEDFLRGFSIQPGMRFERL